MGREVKAQVHFRGLTGAAKALLESDGLILRGDIRLRVPRGELVDGTAEAGDRRLQFVGDRLHELRAQVGEPGAGAGGPQRQEEACGQRHGRRAGHDQGGGGAPGLSCLTL